MVRCYFARSDEAQRFGDDRHTYASEYNRVQREVEALRAESLRYYQTVARVSANRNLYRTAHDEIQTSNTVPGNTRSALQKSSPPTRRTVLRDPYAHAGTAALSSGVPTACGDIYWGPHDSSVETPALADVGAAGMRHSGYYTPSLYGFDAAERGGEAGL